MQCRGRVSRPVTPSSSIFRQKTPIIGLCVPFQPLRGRQIFFPPSPQAQKLRTIKNSLTFELKALPFTAITLTGQIIPALNFSREFLRDLLDCEASQQIPPSRRRLQTLTHLQIPPCLGDACLACFAIRQIPPRKRGDLFILS